MRSIFTIFILTMSVIVQYLQAGDGDFSPLKATPTLHEGRYIPLGVYSKHFLTSNHIELSSNTLKQALFLHLLGHEDLPPSLHFLVKNKAIRNTLQITSPKISYDSLIQKIQEDTKTNIKFIEPVIISHFWETYHQQGKSKLTLAALHPNLKIRFSNNTITIQEVPAQNPWNHLKKGQQFSVSPEQQKSYKKLSDNSLSLLRSIAIVEAHRTPDPYLKEYHNLRSKGVSPKSIGNILNQKHPLQLRLANVAPSFYMLPDKNSPEIWHPLQSISLQVYDETSDALMPIKNFTTYTDEHFELIRNAYVNLKSSLFNESFLEEASTLANTLNSSYTTITKIPYGHTANGPLFFPSTFKLSLESLYSSIPWTLILIVCYSFSILVLLLPFKPVWVYIPLLITFFLHTMTLLLRSYILARPPVSNMTETVLFVPWVSVLAGAALSYVYHSKIPLICASAAATILFLILKLCGLHPPLENVQAVLNSQFWLTIHVLMVVGSYGAFLLAGVIGHVYLLYSYKKSPQPSINTLLSKLILQSMFLGLALLIPGTILGGVWAAQSWGRFWDWDPKESWAFISCCTYLIIVHGHYFGVLKNYGIAVGSVIGLMVIAFTWYGVNYILGTGLHSYGFGNGGENLFYLYLIFETIFLAINSAVRYAKRPSSGLRTP